MKGLLAWLSMSVLAVHGLGAEQSLAWPQFRGWNGSGVSDGQKPPVEFGPNKNVRWKVRVPNGLSSPVVAGDKLIITAFDEGKLFTIAYRRTDGKEVWRAAAPAKTIENYHKTEGSPAASTPATDGERIISYFGSCGLFCYDLAGKELRKLEMPPADTAGGFGSGVSPIIVDGMVILVRDTIADSSIMAVDVATGKQVWRTKRQSPASYCTPVIWNTPEGKQIIAAGHGRLIAYDLKTGAEKWSVSGMPSAVCPSPVVTDDLVLFAGWSPGGPDDKENQPPPFDVMLKKMDKDKNGSLSRAEAEKAFGGFFDSQDLNKDGHISRDEWDTVVKFMSEGRNSAFAVKAGGNGDITNSHVLWTVRKGLPYIASAIVYHGQYVMVKDGGLITACDPKTGKFIYQERVGEAGSYYASPVAANGHIYFFSLEEGVATVLKAGQNTPVVAASNQKLGERVAATPAIADDTLYVRTSSHLYAFSENGSAQKNGR